MRNLLHGGHRPRGRSIAARFKRPEHESARDLAAEVDLRVVGADGRCVRSWPARAVPAGVTKIAWDGLDNRGAPVAAGRYYLVVSDGNGTVRTRAATLVR